MTVPSTRFREDYAGNGSATSFPYAFRIFKATDLVVTKTDSSGTDTTLTLGTDYTVTGAGSYNGGAVVLSTALPTSYRLTIERVLAIRQDTDLRNQGEFLAETHEDAFDRLTMIVQRLAGYLGMGQGGTLRTLLLGTGDVDGAGAFRARGNRISGLGDPVDDADAVGKRWTQEQIAGAVNVNGSSMLGVFSITIDTIAGASGLQWPDKATVIARGRDAVGDGKGGVFRYSASSTTPANGGTVFAPAGGGRLLRELEPGEVLPYECFPATSAGLNAAVKDALDRGAGQISVTDNFSVNGTEITEPLTQVEIVGEGEIEGPYRKWVISHRRGPFVPTNGINPAIHLQKTTEAAAPVVVMMGDSISTEGADAHALTHSMWSIIKEQFQKQNPTKAFTFHNRAIGGQTWLHANTKPTTFPYWYANTALDWLTYIENLQPDCVVLAFGMNDSNGFNSGAPHAVVSKIKAWAKVPDIVFVTNPVPAAATVYPDGTGFGFRGQIFQEGRDLAAGYIRSYARFYGHGLIDINRAMVAMRDGYDTHAGIMQVIETVTPASGTYTAAKGAHDFAIRGVVNGATWPEGKVLSIKAGLDTSDFVFITKTSGNFVVSGFAGGVSTYKSVSTGVAIPGGSFGLEFSIIGGVARLLIDPTGTDFSSASKRVIAEFPVIRGGGLFLPVVSWQGESAGPFTSLTYLSGYGTPKFKQTVTDEDVWGPSNISPDIKPEFGGNGINHYSAKGIELVVRPAIEACDFSCPAYTSGVHAGGRWVKHPDGTAIYSKKVTWTGNIAAANGSLFLSNDAIVDVEFPNIFMSDGASGYVFQSAFHVLSDGAAFVWVISSGASRVNNAIRYRLASTSERTGIAVDIHITMTGRWK